MFVNTRTFQCLEYPHVSRNGFDISQTTGISKMYVVTNAWQRFLQSHGYCEHELWYLVWWGANSLLNDVFETSQSNFILDHRFQKPSSFRFKAIPFINKFTSSASSNQTNLDVCNILSKFSWLSCIIVLGPSIVWTVFNFSRLGQNICWLLFDSTRVSRCIIIFS